MIIFNHTEVEGLAWRYMETLTDEPLFQLLYSDEDVVRTLASMTIQLRATDFLFHQVLTLQDAKPYYLREVCAYILGQIKVDKIEYLQQIPEVLFKLSQDKRLLVKSAAICALGHFYRFHRDKVPVSDEIYQMILNASKHKSAGIRSALAFSLSKMPDCEEVRQTLHRLLEDEDIDVQEWAEVALEILDLEE